MEKSLNPRPLETLILSTVAAASSSVAAATDAGDVVCALHSLAVRLFPVDSAAVAGALDERFGDRVRAAAVVPADAERDEWREAFYRGAGFPAMARILIYNVASDWLASFPLSCRKLVYDSFFTEGPPTEALRALVPALVQHETSEGVDVNAVCSNVERLLILCLIKKGGVRHIAREFGFQCGYDAHAAQSLKAGIFAEISGVAQLLASVPDKARLKSSSTLSSHVFFRQIAIQLLVGAEERAQFLNTGLDALDNSSLDGTFLFVGEAFSRICRRGSSGILVCEMIPRLLDHVRSCLSANDELDPDPIKVKPKSMFWLMLFEAIKDQYAVERLSEELVRQLASRSVSDLEVYGMLWMLFHRTFKHQISTRSMFIDKFLLSKVFPIRCLRWILQFSVFDYPPCAGTQICCKKADAFLDTLQRLLSIWSKREFVQSSSMEQQAYLTAAVGLCVERMSKEELETTKDVLHSILQGVSCRLESPIHLVRKMASAIALVFSKVVDPKNPLYLDDDCCETVNWEFGLISLQEDTTVASHIRKIDHDKKNIHVISTKTKRDTKAETALGETMFSESRPVDPDEAVDLARINGGHLSGNVEEEDNESMNSEASSDSSLQPYDLADDDTDLKKNLSQLVDVAAALRKPDDPDGVERALDVAESLVRASPDELCHNTSDLVRALVHVRCSDVAVEGEEDSAEAKRQNALIALLVTCPFESLDVLTKLLYSPNVDVSQRLMIIDVMIEAAQELSDMKVVSVKNQHDLISTISGNQPWFVPSSRGPTGASPWKEVSETGTSLSWSHRYERLLPSRSGKTKAGKSRRWGLGKKDVRLESKNNFPLYAAAFMLPAMQGFDKIRHGVDLLNRDFIVLGKLIYMLGICMKCITMHPEASALAPSLLDMLKSREISHHAEAYVRRSVLFTASCILVALHPSYVASALIEGNQEISSGLEWIRTLALHAAESDIDQECSSMAMKCLQLHAEMALQTSRSLESADCFQGNTNVMHSKTKDIILPLPSMGFQI